MEEKPRKPQSVTLRLLIIGALILLFMIPSAMIYGLVQERMERQEEAVAEIASKWAKQQIVGGPVITIPFVEITKDADGKPLKQRNYMQLLPQLLDITGKVQPEIRYRGIYKAVLYNAQLTIKGNFTIAELQRLNVPTENILWQEAFVSLNITDMRGIKKDIELDWNGRQFRFEPGISRGNNFFDSGVSVTVPINVTEHGKPIPFSFQLNLNGSEGLYFLPMGRNTSVVIHSPWSNPSFDGVFLPENRQVSVEGFSADWKVLDLNRNYPQYWIGESARHSMKSSSFGFKLFSPVNQYTKTSRAVKYLFMFVILTFLVFFLMEVFNKKRIHPIQYLLVGMALCIFFVLLLSVSEHLNFELAYLIAGISVVLLISSLINLKISSNNSFNLRFLHLTR